MRVKAVSQSEVKEWGCPYCGYRSGFLVVSYAGAGLVHCGDCGLSYVVLAEGVTKSPFGFGTFFPTLELHPRAGTPSHGMVDEPPQTGGEFFTLRGIGSAHYQCFVCGENAQRLQLVNNISAFVTCKAAGERVVEMFDGRAFLDFRAKEPDRVQVKVGACVAHRLNLRKLESLVSDGIITAEKIEQAINIKPEH